MTTDALTQDRLRQLVVSGRSLLFGGLNLEQVHGALLDAAATLVGGRCAVLGILEPDRPGFERVLASVRGPADPGRCGEDSARLHDLVRERGTLHGPHFTEVERASGDLGDLLAVPLRIRGEPYGTLCVLSEEPGTFDASDEESLGVLSDWAATAIENALLFARTESRSEELERAVRGLKATTDIARAVSADPDLHRVLELVVRHGLLLVNARAMVAALCEGDELVVAAQAGRLDNDLRGRRFPIDAPVLGHALRSGRAERLSGASSHDDARAGEGLGELSQAGLVVPMTFRGEGQGVLVAFDREEDGDGFGRDDERLLLSFAASAATAVATARSVAEERLRRSLESAEQERRRWARELHDETLQGLGGLQVLLTSALARPGGGLESAVRTAVEHIGVEIENLRSLIAELRPATLDVLGLEAAIHALVERVERIEDVAVDARVDLPDGRLAPELEVLTYRLVQEALTNVVKHAEAEHVELELRGNDGVLEVTVADDGTGFDAASPARGLGLVGMRERIALARGSFELHTRPGKGTRVHARIPAGGGDPAPAGSAAARQLSSSRRSSA